MSSTTNTPYMTKNMNGRIILSDGAGVTIEGGVITAPTIDLTNLNIDEIQGTAPANNISLYTDSTGIVDVGSSTTAIVNINANNNNILSANSLYMSSTNTSSVLASTINLISNEIIVGGGQNIYQSDTTAQFTIGSNVTDRNFYLGNSSYPPQVPFTATQAFDVVNYDTCVALIASGGGSSTLYADDIYMSTPSAFASLWSDNINGIQLGSNLITNTSAMSFGCNNGTTAISTIGNRTANTYISSGFSNLSDDYIHCGNSSGGNVFIACNNYPTTTGYSTTNVVIGGSSTSTRYNGIVNICAYPLPSGLGSNDVNIGSSTTRTTIQSSALKLNSSNTTANTVAIGSSTTSANTMLATDMYVNSTNTSANNVYVGSATSATTDIKGQTLNINRTNFTAGNVVNIGSNASTINLGETTATVINSFPISPVSASITYSTATGTQIVGSIGYILQGTLVSNGGLTSGTQYTMGTMVIDKGVWMVTANAGYSSGTSTNLQAVRFWLATSAIDDDFTGQMGGGAITTNRTCEIGTHGIWSFNSLSTLRSRLQLFYTGGGMNQNNVNWAFKAVRIA